MSLEEVKANEIAIKAALQEMRDQFEKNQKSADAVTEAQIATLNAKIDSLEAKANTLAAANNRPALSMEEQKGERAKFVKSVVNEFARKGGNGDLHEAFMARADEAKALQVNIDSQGGFLVMPEFGGVIEGVLKEVSPIRQIANVVTIGSDSVNVVSTDSATASGWVGETGSRTVTANTAFNEINITAHELYANPYVTQKMLDDAVVDIDAWLQGEISKEFAQKEGAAFVAGDGVAKPRGFLSYAAGTSFGQIQQVNSGSAAAITADGLISLFYAVKAAHANNGTFVLNRASLKTVRTLKDSVSGQYLWQPGLAAGQPSQLLGRPVVEATDMPVEGAGNLVVAFGDFARGYTIADRIGMRLTRDPYSAKPYVQYYTTKRVGGGVVNFEAIKLLKCST